MSILNIQNVRLKINRELNVIRAYASSCGNIDASDRLRGKQGVVNKQLITEFICAIMGDYESAARLESILKAARKVKGYELAGRGILDSDEVLRNLK